MFFDGDAGGSVYDNIRKFMQFQLIVIVDAVSLIAASTFPSCLSIIDSVLFGFTCYGMYYRFLLRTLLLYYDENFEAAKKDIVWNLYLNCVSNNEMSDSTNQRFVLENKQTYGNTEWLLTRLNTIFYMCNTTGINTFYNKYYIITKK